MPETIDSKKVKQYLLQLQDRLCQTFEVIEDGMRFREDLWERDSGGGGRSRVLSGGKKFEQGGVSFSHIYGDALPPSATSKRPRLTGRKFQALGISVVMHPLNPYVPTTHMNLRFFVSEEQNKLPIWWFGGGYDLTPYYGYEEDVRHWHSTARDTCRDFGDDIYSHYKQWCDEYFYIHHRQEPRGVGGLFFDDLNEWGFDRCFSFLRCIGDSFLPAYLPILERRITMKYGDRQRSFQLYRRGRYVEFNLVYDRGTLFGLQSGGRAESILMSLPPSVRWKYDWHPEPGSEEARLYELFLQPKDWIAP